MKEHPDNIYAEVQDKPKNKGIGIPPFCINCGKQKDEPMIYTGLGNKIGHCKSCLLKKDQNEELFPVHPKYKKLLVKTAMKILSEYTGTKRSVQLKLF